MKCLLSVCLFISMLAGCSVVTEFNEERYKRNNKVGENWISDQSDPAQINISGRWLSDAWGRASLHQENRRVTGTLGDYTVNGVVSGKRAYLLIADGDWYYYSAILESQRPGLLTGRYSRSIPFVKSLSRSMKLEQLAH